MCPPPTPRELTVGQTGQIGRLGRLHRPHRPHRPFRPYLPPGAPIGPFRPEKLGRLQQPDRPPWPCRPFRPLRPIGSTGQVGQFGLFGPCGPVRTGGGSISPPLQSNVLHSVRGHDRPRLADAVRSACAGVPRAASHIRPRCQAGLGRHRAGPWIDWCSRLGGVGLALLLAFSTIGRRLSSLRPPPPFRSARPTCVPAGVAVDRAQQMGLGSFARGGVRSPSAVGCASRSLAPPCLSSRVSGGVCSGSSHRCPGYGGGGGVAGSACPASCLTEACRSASPPRCF